MYQIVRKIVDEESQYAGKTSSLTVSVVHDRIKRSNSSLNRKSKKLLIDSVERVLAVSKDAESEDNDMDLEGGELPGLEQDSESAVQVS